MERTGTILRTNLNVKKRNTKYAGRTKSHLLELRKKQHHSGMMLQMQFIIFLKHQSTHN